MGMVKRIFLFIALNLLVILMVSLVLNIFHVQPYLTAHGIDYSSLMIFCLIWGVAGAFVSLALSRIMAKWMLKVSVIDPQTNEESLKNLLQTVRVLSRKANIPMPEVGIYRSNEVNAFATGPTKNRSLVAVSSGLLHRMNPKEIEGVLGHEISHIANGDMVTMTLLQGVINAFVMFLARVLASLLSGFGKSRESSQGGGNYMSYVLFTYLFEAVFMALGFLVIAAFSRYREFRADAGGSRLAGKESMIAALKSLHALKNSVDIKQNEAIAAFKISRPSKGGLLSLFATHPPLEERIARLEGSSDSCKKPSL